MCNWVTPENHGCQHLFLSPKNNSLKIKRLVTEANLLYSGKSIDCHSDGQDSHRSSIFQ